MTEQIGAALDMRQQNELQPGTQVSLPAHAFSELSHALKLAYANSWELDLTGQHLRTAIWQFLSLLEQNGTNAGDPLKASLRELTLTQWSEGRP
jgi:hypothetical protein